MFEGHGDDLYRYGDKVKYNFSTNIVAGVDHSGLKIWLAEHLDLISSYPEPQPFNLEKDIADSLGIGSENMVVTNGATDAVYRIAQMRAGARSTVSRPTFREYQDACARFLHSISFFNSLKEDQPEADLIWICNPNNPTGEVWKKEMLMEFIDSHPKSLIIVDQAYADYTLEPVINVDEAIAAGNVVLLNSLTKRYSVPGLRIGYAVASEEICRNIRGWGIPWGVNSLAISAAGYLLRHTEDYSIPTAALHDEILRIATGFNNLGITTSDTDSNFLLGRLPEGRRADVLKEWLVENRGILIRDASNFEGLDERCFRVAAQSAEENDLLIKSVEEWMRL